MNPALLVLTDFLPTATSALDYAAALAPPVGARLVLLHLRPDYLLDTAAFACDGPALSNGGRELALNRLCQAQAVPVAAELGDGRLLPTVQDALRRHQPELLVLGQPCAVTTPESLADSTALTLLRHVSVPLLVVPARVAPRPPRRLLLAVDGEPLAPGRHAQTLRALVQALQAEVTLLHVTPAGSDPDLAASRALATVREAGLLPALHPIRHRSVTSPDIAQAIEAAASPAEFDAVVLIARRRSALRLIFHRSVTAQVLLRSRLPVLVLPAIE